MVIEIGGNEVMGSGAGGEGQRGAHGRSRKCGQWRGCTGVTTTYPLETRWLVGLVNGVRNQMRRRTAFDLEMLAAEASRQ